VVVAAGSAHACLRIIVAAAPASALFFRNCLLLVAMRPLGRISNRCSNRYLALIQPSEATVKALALETVKAFTKPNSRRLADPHPEKCRILSRVAATLIVVPKILIAGGRMSSW